MALIEASSRAILALNAGSSSLKFGFYSVGWQSAQTLLSGAAETVADGGYGNFHLTDAAGGPLPAEADAEAKKPLMDRIAALLERHGLPPPEAVGHRIVHGGPRCRRHALIDAEVMQQLEAATAFAPLHLPPALALLRIARERFAGIPHVACLDTAFHADMPLSARTLPIPRRFREAGIERYGFHGLSCESIVRQLGDALPPRLIVAHLGHGASVTAIAHGRSVDTSMGLTPAGGTMMSTRCGDIDPGVLTHLLRELGCDAADIDTMVHRESGMLGVSGISGDMRELRLAAQHDPEARLAIALFCRSVRKHIAAMAAVLGGADLLVFTGGIGENDAEARAAIGEGLTGLGVGRMVTIPSNEAETIAWHAGVLAFNAGIAWTRREK